MVVLVESGTLERTVLGVFQDDAHLLAAVASHEPTAEIETFNEYKTVTYETPYGYRNSFGDVFEVELDELYV